MSDEARKRLLAGVPATERRIRLAGAETVVLEAGEGPPMVLMHGGIECGGVYWAPVMARLAEQYRLVVPDLPGLGESAPFSQLDLDAFAEWSAALVPLTCTGSLCRRPCCGGGMIGWSRCGSATPPTRPAGGRCM